MKPLLILFFAALFMLHASTTNVQSPNAPTQLPRVLSQMQVEQSLGAYFANLAMYFLWVVSDAICLTFGWTGILIANDAGITLATCQLAFIDWYSMQN